MEWLSAQRKLSSKRLTYRLACQFIRTSPNDLYCVEWDVKPYSTTTKLSTKQFAQSEVRNPYEKIHFTFWLNFGLSPNFGLSKRLIQKVKSPNLCQMWIVSLFTVALSALMVHESWPHDFELLIQMAVCAVLWFLSVTRHDIFCLSITWPLTFASYDYLVLYGYNTATELEDIATIRLTVVAHFCPNVMRHDNIKLLTLKCLSWIHLLWTTLYCIWTFCVIMNEKWKTTDKNWCISVYIMCVDIFCSPSDHILVTVDFWLAIFTLLDNKLCINVKLLVKFLGYFLTLMFLVVYTYGCIFSFVFTS